MPRLFSARSVICFVCTWAPACLSHGRTAVSFSLFLISSILFYLFLSALGLCCYKGFSLVAMSAGCSLVAARGLLTAVASLVAEHGLWGAWAP